VKHQQSASQCSTKIEHWTKQSSFPADHRQIHAQAQMKRFEPLPRLVPGAPSSMGPASTAPRLRPAVLMIVTLAAAPPESAPSQTPAARPLAAAACDEGAARALRCAGVRPERARAAGGSRTAFAGAAAVKRKALVAARTCTAGGPATTGCATGADAAAQHMSSAPRLELRVSLPVGI
jgi:hypothetical protein